MEEINATVGHVGHHPTDKDHPLPGTPTPTPVEPPAPAAGYTNLNRVLNTIANEQGIEPGSWPWLQAGPAPWSGQSGEHASFGWNHSHLVTPDWIRAVIANYGHRRTYYDNAPNRQYGYAEGGRPKGWKPEMPGDNPDGSCSYLTSSGIVTVSGPEVEHFCLGPLFAVIDAKPIDVEALGQKFPSTDLAKIMVTLQVRSLMGQIRDMDGDPYPWGYGDRGNSRILDTWLQALKRNLVERDDVETGLAFITDVLLPFYERAPGISKFGTAPAGMFPVGCFNGLYWLLPVFYDATQILSGPVVQRFQAIVERWSQWALELEQAVPGRGFDMSRFYVDEAKFTRTADGKPRDSIADLLEPANIVFDLGWEVWAYRACSVAALVRPAPSLADARGALLRKHGLDPSKRKWIVRPDREPETFFPLGAEA